MSATFHAHVCDRLLQQQLSPDLQAAGLVVRNTFIDFKKPGFTWARKRAQSEGARPVGNGFSDEAGWPTLILSGDEEPLQVAVPMHFVVTSFLPNLEYGNQALIDYWLEQPDLVANGSSARTTLIDFQTPVSAGLEEGYRTPSLWGDEDIGTSMYSKHFNGQCGAPLIYAFDQPAFATNGSPPRETHAVECEVQQSTCDGTCTGCYWHTKSNSCRWGDDCKFCHQCKWVRRT